MSVVFQDYLRMPGPQATRDTAEANFVWNKGVMTVFDFGAIIDGAATDAGNTNKTTTLRGGLLLGKVTATGKLKAWSGTATDGTQNVYGICPFDIHMTDSDAVAQDRTAGIVISCYAKNAKVLNLDANARSQMRGRYTFDDDFFLPGGKFLQFGQQTTKTTNYTVLASDNGTLFDTTGAVASVTFTLPTIAAGLTYGFFSGADQPMIITAPAAILVAFNNLTGTTVTFNTAANQIGSFVRVWANPAATKWMVSVESKNTYVVA